MFLKYIYDWRTIGLIWCREFCGGQEMPHQYMDLGDIVVIRKVFMTPRVYQEFCIRYLMQLERIAIVIDEGAMVKKPRQIRLVHGGRGLQLIRERFSGSRTDYIAALAYALDIGPGKITDVQGVSTDNTNPVLQKNHLLIEIDDSRDSFFTVWLQRLLRFHGRL